MRYSQQLYDDAQNVFCVVCEATTPQEMTKPNIIKQVNENGLSFLRFSSCLQGFHGNRNRNGRLWQKQHIEAMLRDSKVVELVNKGSMVGEAGHPVPDTGKVTLERILTLDPLRISHRITKFDWRGNQLHGTIETLDEGPGTPGVRFMRNILQGMEAAFSLRSVVPQRKNADGTIDVLGPGILKTYDRVFGPSHAEAYQDVDIPVKNVIQSTTIETVVESYLAPVMESYVDYLFSNSDKLKRITDGYDIAMESVHIDPKTSIVSAKLDGEIMFTAPELKHRKDIRNILQNFGV